jgi:TP53 regulating kinase-like protein
METSDTKEVPTLPQSFNQQEDPSGTTVVFAPGEDWELLAQGAEARLWRIPSVREGQQQHNDDDDDDDKLTIRRNNRDMIAKERFRKAYRHPVLDNRLTYQRCRREGRILDKCCKAGLAVPKVWRVTAPVLYMEYLDGPTVRSWLQEQQHHTTMAIQRLGHMMGTAIGRLHAIGIVHGDLTTSNMILMPSSSVQLLDDDGDKKNKNEYDDDNDTTMTDGNGNNTTNTSTNTSTNTTLYLIDFGLAKNSVSDEDRAVDLYVLERAITSTHVPRHVPATFMDDMVLPAYHTALVGGTYNDSTTSCTTTGSTTTGDGVTATTTTVESTAGSTTTAPHKVLQRLEQVRQRGRKRECFG